MEGIESRGNLSCEPDDVGERDTATLEPTSPELDVTPSARQTHDRPWRRVAL